MILLGAHKNCPAWTVNGKLLPGSSEKYPGLQIGSWTEVCKLELSLKSGHWLEWIDRAPLKPLQKMDILEPVTAPRLTYLAECTDVKAEFLEYLDWLSRNGGIYHQAHVTPSCIQAQRMEVWVPPGWWDWFQPYKLKDWIDLLNSQMKQSKYFLRNNKENKPMKSYGYKLQETKKRCHQYGNPNQWQKYPIMGPYYQWWGNNNRMGGSHSRGQLSEIFQLEKDSICKMVKIGIPRPGYWQHWMGKDHQLMHQELQSHIFHRELGTALQVRANIYPTRKLLARGR